jgi:hypothetical protein
MATATKKSHAATPPPDEGSGGSRSLIGLLLRGTDAVYRFLASLKLAVISISTLAAVLAYATFFEKWHGTAAVQEWIYQSKGFAILLAFLGANILCAALIRYPWKKRQTGFVITHAGLLILLGGSWYSLMTSDEGQVAALEGDVKDELVRNDYPVIRVQQVDPHDPNVVLHNWELDFRPGAFAWGPGQPRSQSLLDSVNPAKLLSSSGNDGPSEVLTKPGDPFRMVVKSHIPASIPAVKFVADPSGAPMLKLRPKVKPPGAPNAQDFFPDESERWFASDRRIFKVVKGDRPAQFAFLYVDRPELVDDFLSPPADAGDIGAARFRYTDKAGKSRTYDWSLDNQSGKSMTLPDSDLAVKFVDLVAFPAAQAGLGEMLGSPTIPIAEFEVKKGEGAGVKHFALAGLPMFPNVIPTAKDQGGAPPKPLVSINYDPAPALDPKSNGKFGVVEVMGTPEGSLYYRVYGRSESGKPRGQIRSKGPLKKGQEVVAFGGNPNLPMTLSFSAEDFLTAGVEKEVCEPAILPRAQMGNGIAASLVEMTVKDPEQGGKESTKEFYIRRSASLDQNWKTVSFPNGQYRIAYDVDRKPLGFELKLDDFDRGFDPGTEQASRFQSQVRLTDKSMGIVEKPITISMNEPLTHRGYTFYQSSYIREQDPRTGRDTGRVQSVLQVGKNPGRNIIYAGGLLVVLGAFVQFYMRAGLFSDGGKKERVRTEAAAAKTAAPNAKPESPGELAEAGQTAARLVADDDIL